MASLKTTKTALARELGICRQSLYYKPKKPPLDEEDKQKIIAVMAEHPAYGARRVVWALGMNRKKMQRLMRASNLKPRIRRGFRHVKLDDLGRLETRVTNILKLICPIRPNVVWAGDFTYFWFIDRFWYLAVIDVHTREIIGWHIANHHTTSLIMDAFQDATRRMGTSPKYFHSNQGSEYVSGAYESLLQSYGTQPSHSSKGQPWQNGFQESFYSNFKLELGDIRRFANVGELIKAVHQQIRYYKNERIHSAHRMPPVAFRLRSDSQTTALIHSLLQNQLPGNSV
ncbi:IS3 family transposase [Candidatus Uhrbacteria bacterium]|nr:IS3 family transposase [Candidatus Uhrbacteria bacterium]